jgi:hypothetical protein
VCVCVCVCVCLRLLHHFMRGVSSFSLPMSVKAFVLPASPSFLLYMLDLRVPTYLWRLQQLFQALFKKIFRSLDVALCDASFCQLPTSLFWVQEDPAAGSALLFGTPLPDGRHVKGVCNA